MQRIILQRVKWFLSDDFWNIPDDSRSAIPMHWARWVGLIRVSEKSEKIAFEWNKSSSRLLPIGIAGRRSALTSAKSALGTGWFEASFRSEQRSEGSRENGESGDRQTVDMNIPEGRALLQCSSALQPFTTNDPPSHLQVWQGVRQFDFVLWRD